MQESDKCLFIQVRYVGEGDKSDLRCDTAFTKMAKACCPDAYAVLTIADQINVALAALEVQISIPHRWVWRFVSLLAHRWCIQSYLKSMFADDARS